MKIKYFIIFLIFLVFTSCKKVFAPYQYDPSHKNFFEPVPHGMRLIKQGSFVWGPATQDIDQSSQPNKQISVQSFWMDETEITNNEYRQFVYWVRDSIARQLLAISHPEFYKNPNNTDNPEASGLNWNEKIRWKDPEVQKSIEGLYIPENERFYSMKQIDSRKLIYDYYRIDYQQAAKRENQFNYETQRYEGSVINSEGERIPIKDRSSFIRHEQVPIYPDTLVWIRDFSYAYNEPYTKYYFSHVSFDEYPVVGITWAQAKAFCNWRTQLYNNYQKSQNKPPVQDYRLPTEAEWEYAARGGHEKTLYPWGSYYPNTESGCYIANYKPRRGNYVADSRKNVATMPVGSFDPNDYGLYDMAGNVAEWTSTAFDESGYDIENDFNPEYNYDAKPNDPPALKRKVIRGGSWKDISYYIKNGTRTFEYQDTAKSYIGFRCVKTSFQFDEK